jgi:hypothetical protein
MSIKRINEFPEGSGSLSSDDVFLFMDNPSDTKITKKIALSQITSSIVTGLIPSNTALVPNSTSITNIVSISQSNYDNLATKNANTLYIIRG